MPTNNPSGTNGWEGFGTEEPYGQVTQDSKLASAAPLAGGQIAAGAISAPKKAQAQTAQPAGEARAAHPVTMMPAPAGPDATSVWAQIAATPGAENYPVLAEMASTA